MLLSDFRRFAFDQPHFARFSSLCFFGLFVFGLSIDFLSAAEATKGTFDWTHWRGPSMDGISYETNLPESWSTSGENLLWREEKYATRSTPVVMNGRMYIVCRAFPESTKEGEKTVCLNAETGEMIWESIHNVYLSDAPAERVGWSSVVCDPETDRVFVLGLGCLFECLDAKTGKVIWSHSMSEEYGMLSTYGGRTNFPTIFEDVVIVSGVMTGWGETAIPAHRFVAFDKNTGVAAWLASTKVKPEDTTYSTPVYTSFNGQAAMVFGAADGAVYAIQPRTGKTIWRYQAANRGISTTPLVDSDGVVYCGHGEKNTADTTILGAIFAIDGNSTGDIPEDKLLWKVPKRTVSRAAPIKVGDHVYFIEDGALLMVYEAKTGKLVTEKKLGRSMFGSPVYGDGKIYVGESTGRVSILKPTEKGFDILSQVKMSDDEIFGSPVISNGRVYIPTYAALYCIGSKDRKAEAPPKKIDAPKESPVSEDTEVAHIQLAPVELMLRPGQRARYQVRAYNKKGQYLKLIEEATFSTDNGGSMSDDEYFTAPGESKAAAVTISAKYGELMSTARVRVIPPLPWSIDFNDKVVPSTWIGASYRQQPKEVDGESVLVKISTIPKGTRSQSWMGWANLDNYTVQADFYATDSTGKEKSESLPDCGLIAQRYTLDLQGSQQLQIRSWTSRLELRFAKTIPFNWDVKTWYTMKFQSENVAEGVTLRGKVWKRGEPEPDAWIIEATDATPNRNGSPGLFGNSTKAEFYIDNVSVVPNSK
ncbi:MAG: PQQ-binding-like beta-propeller repeat protein [Pirellulaceae bacterium]|nr:PQQ-binding-like beta-propeller repeat protein [Pirellulaceae bacterium]